MKTIQINIQVKQLNTEGEGIGCPNSFRVLNELQSQLDGESGLQTIYVTNEVSLEGLAAEITKQYLNHEGEEMITVRNGVSGGCYGARDGKRYEGLTLYCDSSLFPERFIDDEFDEIVNIESLLDDVAEKTDLDPDSVHETCEALGVESYRDNTYNYLGNDLESPQPLSHANFSIYENENGSGLLVIKFHNGGDIRGNYSDEVVYKFDDIWDLHNALSPRIELINQDNIREIDSLKQGLWSAKGEELLNLRTQIKALI